MRFSSKARNSSSSGGNGFGHGGGDDRHRQENMSSSNYSARRNSNTSSHHTNGRAKQRKRQTQPDPRQYIFRMAILWIIGVVLIEFFFFYTSIRGLDRALLRGQRTEEDEPLSLLDIYTSEDEKERPPRPKKAPPPKQSLLPKKVITIVGPESSGTTFLSTTLGIAVGAFEEDGGWFHTPAWAFSHSIPADDKDKEKDKDDKNKDSHTTSRHRVHRQYHPEGRWEYEKDIGRRAMSVDGEWEIQHLSLPWGWVCEEGKDVKVVEALVPEECFRYEDPWSHLHPKTAERLLYATGPQKRDAAFKAKYHGDKDRADAGKDHAADYDMANEEKERLAKMCREEAKISQDNDDGDGWTCGATCGTGKYDGYALYPQRFSVNITSHIEWYLSRGVDIKVVLLMRDRTISSRGKLKGGHCPLADVGRKEDEVALSLMADAMKKYGSVKEEQRRLISVSYEGMMTMRESYLHQLYHQLGINSSYIPSFKDGNKKYIIDANTRKKEDSLQLDLFGRPPVPQIYLPPPPKKNLLPKRVIAVFGPESSGTRFLSSALGVATKSFPTGGMWNRVLLPSDNNDASLPPMEEWVFHEHNYRRAMSLDGEWEVQHISLPWGWTCGEEGSAEDDDDDDAGKANVVEALVPGECFRYASDPELSPESAERVWHMEKKNKNGAYRGRGTNGHAGGHGRHDGMRHPLEEPALEAAIMKQCRTEVRIAEDSSTSWTCGAECGSGQFNGFALYPRRFMVNITSHIEWYRSRGVHVTALLSMRDHSISRKGKLRDHCHIHGAAEEEDKLALTLMKESLEKYGRLNSNGSPHVIPVSYEGLMQFKGAYMMNLYKQLGISSSNLPRFEDGNEKYVKDEEEYLPALPRQKPKQHFLPKKVIAVFGPESSGTTFLATTLGMAVGAVHSPEVNIGRQAASADGEWEVQHLSLPWGWECEKNETTHVVEALVPGECFRYEREPGLQPDLAASMFFKHKEGQKAGDLMSRILDCAKKKEKAVVRTQEEKQLLSRCRNEVKISQNHDEWTCGAMCGTGKFNGFALYPQRFFVNITSHIEWYLSRGVEITVVLSMRDRNISSKGKLKGHCHLADVGLREDEIALSLMADAMKKYGGINSRHGPFPEAVSGKERAITVSYEGLMEMKKAYLFGLYKELGINSTYIPQFNDGNEKYVTNANLANVGKKELKEELEHQKVKLDSRPPKPKTSRPLSPKSSLLPKKLITVVDSSSFVTTTLAVAAGAFPSEGRWIEKVSSYFDGRSADGHNANSPHELVFEDTVKRHVTSSNGDWAIQHLSLPQGWKCNSDIDHLTDLVVEALVPEECFHVNSALNVSNDPKIMEQCRNEVHIAEDSTSWTCGAKCGSGESNGLALYPKRFFVNITSHIEWYLSRGVDITVVLSMRDRSVSMKEKMKNDCSVLDMAAEEKKMEAAIKKEAYSKYGKHGSLLKNGDKERVVAVSYEGLLELKEVYLFDLYHRLGINSSYIPMFINDNAKYVAYPTINTTLKKQSMRHKKKAAPLHFLPWWKVKS